MPPRNSRQAPNPPAGIPQPPASAPPAPVPPPPPPALPPPADLDSDDEFFASIVIPPSLNQTDAQRRASRLAAQTPQLKSAGNKATMFQSRPVVEKRTELGHVLLVSRWKDYQNYILTFGDLDDEEDYVTPRTPREGPPDLFDPKLKENELRALPTRLPTASELKGFALYLARSIRGVRIVDANGQLVNKPRISTIEDRTRVAVSLFERYFSTPIPGPARVQLNKYLASEEFLDQDLTTTFAVEKAELPWEDLLRMVAALHAHPELVRTKHALLTATTVFQMTRIFGGRVGEFIESGCHSGSGESTRYGKDVKYYAFPSIPGTMSPPILAAQFATRYHKGIRRDKSAVKIYVIVAVRNGNATMCIATSLFHHAFSDDIFEEFRTPRQLINSLIDRPIELTIKSEWIDRFVFRADAFDQETGIVRTTEDRAYPYRQYLAVWHASRRYAGITRVLVPHRARLSQFEDVFVQCGQFEQMKIGKHQNVDSFRNAYIASVIKSDLASVAQGLPQQESVKNFGRYIASAGRGATSSGTNSLSAIEKRKLIDRHPDLQTALTNLQALSGQTHRLGTPEYVQEFKNANKHFMRSFLSAQKAAIEGKLKRASAKENKKVEIAMASGSSLAATAPEPTAAPEYPNEWARVAYTPLDADESPASPMEGNVRLIEAFLTVPYHTRLPSLAGLPALEPGRLCPECGEKVENGGHGGAAIAALHVIRCWSKKLAREALADVILEEWTPMACPRCSTKKGTIHHATVFSTREEWYDHLRSAHVVGHKCGYCLKTDNFPGQPEAIVHYAQEHGVHLDPYVDYRFLPQEWIVDVNGRTDDVASTLSSEYDAYYACPPREDAPSVPSTSPGLTSTTGSGRQFIIFEPTFSWEGTHPDYHPRHEGALIFHLGICIFCVHNTTLDWTPRLYQYRRRTLAEHTERHISSLSPDAEHHCPSPSCGLAFFDQAALRVHMATIHLIPVFGVVGDRERKGVARSAYALYAGPDAGAVPAVVAPAVEAGDSSRWIGVPVGSRRWCTCGSCLSNNETLDKHILEAGPESLCAHMGIFRLGSMTSPTLYNWTPPAHADSVLPKPLPGTAAYLCIAKKNCNQLLVALDPATHPCLLSATGTSRHAYLSFKSGSNRSITHQALSITSRQVVRPRHACECGRVVYDIRLHTEEMSQVEDEPVAVETIPSKAKRAPGKRRKARTHTMFFPGPEVRSPVPIADWEQDAPPFPMLVRCAEVGCQLVFARWQDHPDTIPPGVKTSAIAESPKKAQKNASCAASLFNVLDDQGIWSEQEYTRDELQTLVAETDAERLLTPWTASWWPGSSSPTGPTTPSRLPSSMPSSPITPTPASPITAVPAWPAYTPLATVFPPLAPPPSFARSPSPACLSAPGLFDEGVFDDAIMNEYGSWESPVSFGGGGPGSASFTPTSSYYGTGVAGPSLGAAPRDDLRATPSQHMDWNTEPRVQFNLPNILGDVTPLRRTDTASANSLSTATVAPWTYESELGGDSSIPLVEPYARNAGLLTPVTPSMATLGGLTAGSFPGAWTWDGTNASIPPGASAWGNKSLSPSSHGAWPTREGASADMPIGLSTPVTPSATWASRDASTIRGRQEEEEGGESPYKRQRFG